MEAQQGGELSGSAQAWDLLGFFIRLLPPYAIKNALEYLCSSETLRTGEEKIHNVISKVHF